MKIVTRSRNSVVIELERSLSKYRFLIEEVDRPPNESALRVTVPGDRIMYGTEEGNSGAEYVLLLK